MCRASALLWRKNIVDYRAEHGPFASRRELLKVPRLGAKAFEQCAGFLRIVGGKNPLDNTAVHPERYELVEQMAKDAGCTVGTPLIASTETRNGIDLKRYCSGMVGLPDAQRHHGANLPNRGVTRAAQHRCFPSTIPSTPPSTTSWWAWWCRALSQNITRFGCFVDMGIKVRRASFMFANGGTLR